jgi:hypothetical protein
MDKLEDIVILFFAGGDGRPYPFAPAHTGLAAGALRDTAVDHSVADFALGSIICRLNIWCSQEAKIIFRRFALKTPSQFFAQGMVRPTTHPAQKALLDLFHFSGKTVVSKCIATMQRFKKSRIQLPSATRTVLNRE